jgi:hypothetical protein
MQNLPRQASSSTMSRGSLRTTTMVGIGLLTFLLWTAATWALEGRIQTLLRPDATIDRAIYALVANLLIGILGTILVLRWFRDVGGMDPAKSGFNTVARSIVWIPIGVLLGLAFYWLQGAPSTHPIVILNAFAQVFIVSAAEVLVCWALLERCVEAAMATKGKIAALAVASVVASVLFGVYHFAHSAPFNTAAMVALLSVVGLVTSVFFFVSREAIATIVFHNFLGTFGVVQALKASGSLSSFEQPQPPLLITALVTVLVLAGGHCWLRRGASVDNALPSYTPGRA